MGLPPFITQNYLLTYLVFPVVVAVVGVIAAAIVKQGWVAALIIGLITGLIALGVIYLAVPPGPRPSWEWLDSEALPRPPSYLDPIRKEVGGYSPDPIDGEGRRWVQETRERNKYATIFKDKKTGDNAELQPLDRKYAASPELAADKLPKRLQVIPSDIVLLANTLAKEEDGWHLIGKTQGVPKPDAEVSLTGSDVKAKSFRIVVCLFPLTARAGDTLMDYVEKKSVALIEAH